MRLIDGHPQLVFDAMQLHNPSKPVHKHMARGALPRAYHAKVCVMFASRARGVAARMRVASMPAGATLVTVLCPINANYCEASKPLKGVVWVCFDEALSGPDEMSLIARQ